MTANLSHEMNTPLNCIITFAEKTIKYLTNKEHKKILLMIKHSANAIKFQVKTLLDKNLLENKMLGPNY